jgi:two-component system LytT family response regulator
VRSGERTYPVPTRDIRWLQSDGNYVDLHTASGTHTIREPLASVEARLDPARFVRVHRRVIVALDQIRELQPWFAGDQVLILKDGTKLRVSRTRRALLAERLEGRA